MALTLQKLIRKSQPARLIAALQNQPAQNPIAPFVFSEPHLAETKPDNQRGPNLSLFLSSPTIENSTSSQFSQIYPSFPFGYCLNPGLSTGSIPSESGDLGLDDSNTIWADSVKKKRKKKMNKHKYRKLRKRLRRQT